MINIRKANISDFDSLYKIGMNTTELTVSATEPFMDADEFSQGIEDSASVFLVAENDQKEIIGFIYASDLNYGKSLERKTAFLIYLVVLPEFRKMGLAQRLYDEAELLLRERGVNIICGWANAESDGAIVGFMKKQGFNIGHTYVWVDKKLQ